MSDFFDPTSVDDLDLLHSSVREDDELVNVVNKVEWEVIDAFKQREFHHRGTYAAFFDYESGSDPAHEIVVRLVGYDEDTPANSEPDLKEALRRTIADVVTWVLTNYNGKPGLVSRKQGPRSETFSRVPTWRDWPAGWDVKLRNFDVRTPLYST